MSEKFTRETMKPGEVYRLVHSRNGKEYIGKLFIAGSNSDTPGRVEHATCFEDGFSFFGFMESAEFEEAEAKIIDLS